jgi:hypothetical protein
MAQQVQRIRAHRRRGRAPDRRRGRARRSRAPLRRGAGVIRRPRSSLAARAGQGEGSRRVLPSR